MATVNQSPASAVEGATQMTGTRTKPASSVRNVAWNWIVFLFSVSVTFVQSPFIVRSLGAANYGIWVLVGSLVGYLGLLDFGVRAAVTRYVARMHAERADGDASRLVSTALTIFGLLAAIALVGAGVIATLVLPRFALAAHELGTARTLVLVTGATLATGLLGGTFGGVIIGLQRFDISGMIDVGMGAIQATLVFLVLRSGFGVTALALIQLVIGLGRLTMLTIAARRLYPELRVRPVWDRNWVQLIFSFSVFSTLITFSTTIILYSDSLVIGAFLSATQITFFSIASSLTEYARTVVRGISTTMTPKVSASEGWGPEALGRLVLRATRMATVLILPIGITFFFRGARFIGIWMGPTFSGPSGQVLRILTTAMVFYGSAQVVGSSLLGLSRHSKLVPIFVAEAIMNLGLSVLLIRHIGLPGVALGTVVPNMLSSLVLFPLLVKRELGVPVLTFYRETWIRPLLASIPFAVVTVLVERFAPVRGLFPYFGLVAVTLPVWAAGAWALALNPEERSIVRTAVRRRLEAVPGFARLLAS